MRDYFVRLFEYDHWANEAVLASIRGCSAVPERAVGWLGHVLVAQQFVFEVLQGRDGNWLQDRADPMIKEIGPMMSQISRDWQDYLSGLTDDGIRGTIMFRNSRGEMVTRRIADLLTHAVNHSTYHRGQIAIEVRAAGGEPARTDFPVWAGMQKS